jgi:hypothetical protein
MTFLIVALVLIAVGAVGLAIQRAYFPACVAAGLAVWVLASVAPHLG